MKGRKPKWEFDQVVVAGNVIPFIRQIKALVHRPYYYYKANEGCKKKEKE